MRDYSNTTKRLQAVILAIALVFSAVNPILWLGISAGAEGTAQITDAEIIAKNYDLTPGEIALLKSGYLVDESEYIYRAPTDEDDLVDVKTNTKTITAKAFKELGYTWVPEEAVLTYGSETEKVTLVDGEGNYECTADAFSVEVKYVLYIDVPEETQGALLGAAPALKQGVANLDAIYDAQSGVSLVLKTAMPFLKQLADGISVPFGTGTITVKMKEAGINAVKALATQLEANGGEKFNVDVLMDSYAAADTKVGFLLENGAKTETEFDAFHSYAKDVLNDPIWNDAFLQVYLEMYDVEKLEQKSQLINFLTSWVSTTAPVYDDTWDAAHTTYVAANADLAALDLIISKLDDVTTISSYKNPLVAAEAKVHFNMSMYDVKVTVVLNVAKADGVVVKYDSTSTTIVVTDGATADSVIAAVAANGVEANALNTWKDTYVEGQFDRTTTVLPSVVDSDIDYVITYTPKNYKVTYKYDSTEKTLPYGAQITLPVASDSAKAYDYYVNGVKYAQGSVVDVEADMAIERELGKAYVDGSLYEIVADNFFGKDDAAYKILTSEALLDDVVVSVRYPEVADNLVTLTDNTILKADKFKSGYNGRVWAPYTYTIVGGANAGEYLFNDATQVTLPAGEFDRVDVVYRLDLGYDADEAKDLANIPYVLVTEAKDQKAALDRISTTNIMSNLEDLTPGVLAGLKGMVSEAPISEENKVYFTDVITALSKECFTGNSFTLYNLLVEYQDSGLVYYYNNSAEFIKELETLSKYLTMMVADDDKEAALVAIVGVAGDQYSSYADRIKDLESIMSDVRAKLDPPNKLIDLNSANLGDFVALLESSEAIEETTVAKDLYLESETFMKDSDKNITVVYSVNVAGKGIKTYSITFDKKHVLTANDIANINKAIANKVAELGLDGVDDVFYSTNYKANALDAAVGSTPDALLDAETVFTWAPKTVKLFIAGKDTGLVLSVNKLSVDLPKSVDAAFRYEYKLNGVTVPAGRYTFTLAELKALLGAGSVNFDRVEISVAREDLTKFVDDLNAAIDGNAIGFALVENNGKYTIVMKVNAAQTNALMGAVKGTAMTLLTSNYSYVGLGGNDVLYMDDEMNIKVSVQAIIDSVMNSGFGTQTIIDVMDANGNIKNITVNGEVLSNEKLGVWGGKLIKTTMQLGTQREGALDVDFYVTLGNAPAQLTTARNLLAGQAKNYFNVVCEDGKAVVNLTMPQKAYEAYLAVLLATDNVNLSNVDAVNGEIAIGFVKDLVDPILTGSVTTTTLTNTLSKFGYNLNLVGYEDLFNMFSSKYSELEITYDEKSATTTANFNIASLLDSLGLPGVSTMIVEYEEGVNITGSVTLQNIGTDYEALYVDITASGITNKAGLTTNLKDKLANVSGTALIVLLDDVKGDLVFNTTTVLNLNGFTVEGNVVAKGNVTVVDSSLSDNGGVNGTVSGNATVIAGTYTSDVSAFLKEGYVQDEAGVVGNEFFNLVKDSDGNVTLELDAGILATQSVPNVKALALDVVLDLLFNGYTTNMLSIEGNEVYDLTYSDFVALYASSDRLDKAVKSLAKMFDSPAIANVINMFVEDMTDFAAIKDAIENNSAVVSYEITTGAWTPVVEHVIDGDYITVGIGTGNVKSSLFNIVITGSDEEKDSLAGLVGIFDETVKDVDAKVEMNHGFVGNNLVFDWSTSGKLVIDLTAPKYAVMLSVIVADGIGAPANAQLVDGIKAYFTTNDMTTLDYAFNALTTAQVVNAVKNFTFDDSFEDMLVSLDLGVMSEDVKELEKDFDDVAKLFAAIVRKVNLNGGTRTIGSYLDADGTYSFSRANITKTFARNLVKGYSITLNAEVTSVYVSIKLFGEVEIPEVEVPEFVDETGTPTFTADDKIAAFYIDTQNKVIYIDVNIIDFMNDGITVGEFLELLNLSTINADNVTKYISKGEEGIKSADLLVCTGDKLTALATRENTELFDVVEYTIIVIGDVNKNGRTDTGDAAWIAENYVLLREFDEVQMLAGDIGRNGRVEVGDAALVATKYVTEWKDYKSAWAK